MRSSGLRMRKRLLEREGDGRSGTLADWRKEADLAGARHHIEDLPVAERAGWEKLWADVDRAVAGPQRER